ncbi:hypothetical protein [Micromonospora sp. DPT]|uniref:hypothetical protein n=1 Tax=Micromonospora sp. DPT TaxID=3142975 RepID=UPI0032095A34
MITANDPHSSRAASAVSGLAPHPIVQPNCGDVPELEAVIGPHVTILVDVQMEVFVQPDTACTGVSSYRSSTRYAPLAPNLPIGECRWKLPSGPAEGVRKTCNEPNRQGKRDADAGLPVAGKGSDAIKAAVGHVACLAHVAEPGRADDVAMRVMDVNHLAGHAIRRIERSHRQAGLLQPFAEQGRDDPAEWPSNGGPLRLLFFVLEAA